MQKNVLHISRIQRNIKNAIPYRIVPEWHNDKIGKTLIWVQRSKFEVIFKETTNKFRKIYRTLIFMVPLKMKQSRKLEINYTDPDRVGTEVSPFLISLF